MRTGEVEANLLSLNETAKLPYIDDLVERKLTGPEKGGKRYVQEWEVPSFVSRVVGR